MGGQRHASAALPSEKTEPIIRQTGRGSREKLILPQKSTPTGSLTPVRPARSESLCRVSDTNVDELN